MLLIKCEINLILALSANCFIMANAFDAEVSTLAITDTKLYVPVITLSVNDNAKLLEWLKSSFEKTINWNKY